MRSLVYLTPESESADSSADESGQGYLSPGDLANTYELQEHVAAPRTSRYQNANVGEKDDVSTPPSLGQRTGSVSTTQSYQLYTPTEEKALLQKLDRRLVLFVSLLYMLSYLDRSSKKHSAPPVIANH